MNVSEEPTTNYQALTISSNPAPSYNTRPFFRNLLDGGKFAAGRQLQQQNAEAPAKRPPRLAPLVSISIDHTHYPRIVCIHRLESRAAVKRAGPGQIKVCTKPGVSSPPSRASCLRCHLLLQQGRAPHKLGHLRRRDRQRLRPLRRSHTQLENRPIDRHPLSSGRQFGLFAGQAPSGLRRSPNLGPSLFSAQFSAYGV